MKKLRVTQKTVLCVSTIALAGGLVACQGPTTKDIDTTTMGNASAVQSPESADPAGEVIALDSAYAQVTDMDHAGDTLALRSGSTLAVGTLADFKGNSAATIDIDEQCGDLTSTDTEFVLACPDGVHVFDAASKSESAVLPTDRAVTTATKNTDGSVIAGFKDENKAVKISGDESKEFNTEYSTTEMVSIPVDGKPDAVVRTNSEYTIIQDINVDEADSGAILRVGRGVGHVAPAEKGMALVTDNRGSQLMVYFADDVVRLQKTIPVDESPWGVAWDSQNRTAYVASTSNNQLVGWDVSAPSMKETERFNTVANALNVVVLPQGEKVLASASGEGLQVIS